jgi:hypothetical protein
MWSLRRWPGSLRTQTGWDLKVRVRLILARQERPAPFRSLQAIVDSEQHEIAAILKAVQVTTEMQWNLVFRAACWNDLFGV